MQSSFEGEERSIFHIVQGGYSKGSGSTVDILIDLVQEPEAMFHASKFIVGVRCALTITHISCT